MPGGPVIITLGCRLNSRDSLVMRRAALAAGMENAVIINSCAVTAEAERQTRQAVRRARREYPERTVIVAGCAVQIAPDKWKGESAADFALGTREKLLPEIYERIRQTPRDHGGASGVMAGTPAMAKEPEPDGDIPCPGENGGRIRAFVRIQTGCDHNCTFCIIPLARGPSRSVPPEAIVAACRQHVAAGVREIVLAGVDIASYGTDLPGTGGIATMMRRLLAEVPGLPRLRLSSLDPVAIGPELVALFGEEPRLAPHLHLSLQSGDDLILKRMKRRHSTAGVARALDALRRARPDIALGADLIAGFPTESDTAFDTTCRRIREFGLTFLHVFPYSVRPGTPAARMPQLPPPLCRERARQLRRIGMDQEIAWARGWHGKIVHPAMETPQQGRTEHYGRFRMRVPATPGEIARARITRVEGNLMTGTPLA